MNLASIVAISVLNPAGARPTERSSGQQLSFRRQLSPAVVFIVLIVLGSVVPSFAGYLLEPPGQHFTGAPTYAEDVAQHESWASEMATHLFYRNLLTPEPTERGWFFSPLELLLGLTHRATKIPYAVLFNSLALACAPALAFGLITIAYRAGLQHPGVAAVLALLAGSFVPFVHAAVMMGLVHGNLATMQSVGGDATPVFAGPGVYLMLAVLTLATLPTAETKDPEPSFRLAGVVLFALGAIYPFFIPVLWLTVGLCAPLWVRWWGWRRTLKGASWLAISIPPMLYWILLPRLDPEYARFAAGNWRPLFSPIVTVVSLGLGAGAIIGLPRLLRGSAYQQMLGCFAVAFILALYIPAYPWRSHIFYLSPILVIAAIAAWWPVLLRVPRVLRWILVGGLVAAATASVPYYYTRNVSGLFHFAPPVYLTSGDQAAIQWLADQPGTDVVLARSDLSPWVASRGHHRVIVGDYLWTHDYQRRRAEVEAIFQNGVDPRPLLRAEHVAWVLIDEDRGVPGWARGVEPTARFAETVVLRADTLLADRGESTRTPHERIDED